MNVRQKQAMDSLLRLRAFVDAYPATGCLSYASERERLDDVLRRQADQIAALFDHHMRPVVTIARAESPDSNCPHGERLTRSPETGSPSASVAIRATIPSSA